MFELAAARHCTARGPVKRRKNMARVRLSCARLGECEKVTKNMIKLVIERDSLKIYGIAKIR